MHINSYRYPEPAIKAIALLKRHAKVAIVGRSASAFYQTTCASAEALVKHYKLTLAFPRIQYAAAGASSMAANETFQRELARQVCNRYFHARAVAHSCVLTPLMRF